MKRSVFLLLVASQSFGMGSGPHGGPFPILVADNRGPTGGGYSGGGFLVYQTEMAPQPISPPPVTSVPVLPSPEPIVSKKQPAWKAIEKEYESLKRKNPCSGCEDPQCQERYLDEEAKRICLRCPDQTYSEVRVGIRDRDQMMNGKHPCVEWQSEDPEFLENLRKLYNRLDRPLKVTSPEKETIRQIGLISVVESDHAYSAQDYEASDFYYELAKEFADLAVGWDPVTGFGRSAYELVTGKNLVTGVELSQFDRSLAFVGMLSLGGSKAGSGMWRIFEKAASIIKNERGSIEIAMKQGERLARRAANVLAGWKDNHVIRDIVSAERENHAWTSQGGSAPFQQGSYVIHFDTIRTSKWVRVFKEGTNETGNWMMRPNAVKGLTAEQIESKFALPFRPTHIQDVYLPGGTPMKRGNVSHETFQNPNSKSGAVQYLLADEHKKEWFKNFRRLPK